MKFLELAQRNYDELAEIVPREHGKTIADAKGDIQRGPEVVEACIGAPHMMEGRVHARRPPPVPRLFDAPATRSGGITPFNFPAMIPLWKIALALVLRQCLHPEAVRAPSGRAAPNRRECSLKPGLRAGILDVRGNGDKEVARRHSRRCRHQGHRLRRFYSPSRTTSIRGARRAKKRVQCFGGAKNHMMIHARRRHGPDGRRADRRGLPLGWPSRCMAISGRRAGWQ